MKCPICNKRCTGAGAGVMFRYYYLWHHLMASHDVDLWDPDKEDEYCLICGARCTISINGVWLMDIFKHYAMRHSENVEETLMLLALR